MLHSQQKGEGLSVVAIEGYKGRLCSTIKEEESAYLSWDEVWRFFDAHNYFVTLSKINYESNTFPQVSFYILSYHILLISLYHISTLFISSVQNPNVIFCPSDATPLGEARHDNASHLSVHVKLLLLIRTVQVIATTINWFFVNTGLDTTHMKAMRLDQATKRFDTM